MKRTKPFWSSVELVTGEAEECKVNVSLEDLDSFSGRLLSDIASPDRPLKSGIPFHNGDVLFGKLRPYLAKSWVVDRRGVAVGDIHVYRPRPTTTSKFIGYLTLSAPFIEYATINSYGTKMPRTEWKTIANFRHIPLPKSLQNRATDYLDRETAEIDAAVSDLDEYIHLLNLRERGLVEKLLMRTPLSKAPIGLIGNVQLGKMLASKPATPNCEVRPYLRAAHVQPGGVLDLSVTETHMWFAPHETERLDLRKHDVVVVEGGAGFGRSAVISEDMPEWGFQNSINRVRVDPNLADPRFVQAMLDRALQNGQIANTVDTATLPHFTAEKLAKFRIPYGPLALQRKMADRIESAKQESAAIIADAARLRDLLLKRRSVLITEVVTGKKKV